MFSSRNPGERPKSLVFRDSTAQPDEPFNMPLSPLRNLNITRNMGPPPPPSEPRNSLQRRFTTNALPSLAPIGEQRKQANGGTENMIKSQAYNRASQSEHRARQYEALLEQQRSIQAQMNMIDPETRREVDEARKLEQDISQYAADVLNESDAAQQTQRQAQATFTTQQNHYSGSAKSPGVMSHLHTAQVTSPPSELTNPYFPAQSIPSQSMPTSQRNSDHEESDDDYKFSFRPKAGANPNRNSLPVTAFDLRTQERALAGFSPVLRNANGVSLHFGDDDGRKSKRSSAIINTSPDPKTFLQLHQTDDKFPILVRRGTDSVNAFSGPVTPLDHSEEEGYPRTEHSVAARHRQSLPPGVIRGSSYLNEGLSGLGSAMSDATAKNTAANRRSLEVNFGAVMDNKRPSLMASPLKPGLVNSKVPASYSTNDIPTLKTMTGQDSKTYQSAAHTPSEEKAAFHDARDSPLYTQGSTPSDLEGLHRQTSNGMYGAQPFSPPRQPVQNEAPYGAHGQVGTVQHFSRPTTMNGYNSMDIITNSFSNMSGVGQPRSNWSSTPGPAYQNGFHDYNGYTYGPAGPVANRFNDGGNRQAGQRRATHTNDDYSARFANVPLEALKGEISGLCKDQHGCRFLQKKLEERNPEHTAIIFEETLPHVVDLMTDPFGNYLCQKLLEYANDEQRTALIGEASGMMVKIALNQHGTRALQKMIEFVGTQQQIDMITVALKDQVVQLIQDLNGNHVIQKCLNHLSQENMQFIIDAVCNHVVDVGTHRHGCCVLQRCVDHSSAVQKGQLVSAITDSVFALVQDPFGNYVVQYILDLGEPTFSEPICNSMVGSVFILSRQKFSSNVIEKGIRTAGEDTRRRLIQEMLQPSELQKMLRDSFGNYVVQTAMDYADEETKTALYDLIRPMLPNIRHTPHGRRIQGKIQEHDGRRADALGLPREVPMAPQYPGQGMGMGMGMPRSQFGHAGFGPAAMDPAMMQYGYGGPPHGAYGGPPQGRMHPGPGYNRGGHQNMNFF